METRHIQNKGFRFSGWLLCLFVAGLFFAGTTGVNAQPNGEALFKTNCSSCHSASTKRGTGPGLAGVTQRRSMEWILKWVANPAALVASGDADAIAVMKDYNNFPMPPQTLNEEEVKAVMQYVEDTEAKRIEKVKADSLAKVARDAAAPKGPGPKPQFLSPAIKWTIAIVGGLAILFLSFMSYINNIMVESVGHGLPYFDHSEGGQMDKWISNNKAFVFFFAFIVIMVCIRFIWVFLNHL